MTKVLIPSGALGLGYDAEALARGVAMQPDLIAIDGGSTDSGPSYLGRGVSKYARASTKSEWAGLIKARDKAGCPLVIGTAGTCGTDSTVDWLLDITREVLAETGLTAKIATLKSEQDSGLIARARLTPLPGAPDVDADTIADCTHIVALAGVEQITAALKTGADIIIAGRTTDTATIAALPILRGDNPGAAWHGAKIGECGAFCASNPQSGVIMLDFDADGFTITPLAKGAKATPQTVSAHMLYENSDPYILYEPGGHLDVRGSHYAAVDDTSVRVTGSKWVPSETYTVKLEGSRVVGHQCMVIATIRDAHYVANVQAWCDDIVIQHRAKVIDRLGAVDFTLDMRIIGQDATLGPLENRAMPLVEVGVMGIVTADAAATAHDIARLLNPYLLHHALTRDEEVPTFAFPFSPAEVVLGPLYSFALHHVMALSDPMDAFRLEVIA